MQTSTDTPPSMQTSRTPEGRAESDSRTPSDVTLHVRRPSFEFDGVPRYWFDGNPWWTHFGTALMLVFPSGERFVIEGVRRFKNQIRDPKLAEEVARFCTQEGIHSREHAKLNEALFALGFPGLRRLERLQRRGLELLARVAPARFQLALAASIEHLTSSFGHQALAERHEFATMHPAVRELLVWHAVEEIEHKSVAFDVHRAMGGWHATRVLGLLFVLPMVLATTYGIFLASLWADGRLFDLTMWKREFLDTQLENLGRVLRGERARGVFGALPRDVVAFLRPGFHPWQVDDRDLIRESAQYDPMAVLARGAAS